MGSILGVLPFVPTFSLGKHFYQIPNKNTKCRPPKAGSIFYKKVSKNMIKPSSVIKYLLLICFAVSWGQGKDLYTGTGDLRHYLRIKAKSDRPQLQLSNAKQQHILKFPYSPFNEFFDLLIYHKTVETLFPKSKGKQRGLSQAVPKHIFLASLPTFKRYVGWRRFTVEELETFETLLFAYMSKYGKTAALIKPYKEYLSLYKEKMGDNWQVTYSGHLKSQRVDMGHLAWYTYKAAEFPLAHSLYTDLLKFKPENSQWFYLGLTLFHLSRYREAQRTLKTFLNKKGKSRADKKKLFHAHYYYYRCFDKLRTGKSKLREIHQYCQKHPREKMYRLLLRMAKRHRYPHYQAIRREFLRRFPHSRTAYLQNRERAFSLLQKGNRSGLTLLKKAYRGQRKKDYEEIALWLFEPRRGKKQAHFAKGGNWFLDYFYQKGGRHYPQAWWQQWMEQSQPGPGQLTDHFIKSHKVLYSKNERKKWQWFKQTSQGHGPRPSIPHWRRYRQRIKAFVRFGYEDLIEKEIKSNFPKNSLSRLLYLKELYHLTSNTYRLALLYNRLIHSYGSLAGGLPYSLYKQAYPRPRYRQVKALAKRHRIPVALIYGVMRAESYYKERAVSSAGAIGLMQIMPATGEWIYKRTSLAKKYPYDLFSPKLNLAIAAQFLGDLYRRFDGNVVLTAAAYNAGGGAVKKWMRKQKARRADVKDDWVYFSYFIPYDETERYVRKVIVNMQIYRTVYPHLNNF